MTIGLATILTLTMALALETGMVGGIERFCLSGAYQNQSVSSYVTQPSHRQLYCDGTPAATLQNMAALTEYLNAAMRHAEYERLEEGDWYAHVPGLAGLWASAKTVEDTRNDLLSALEDWLYVNAYVGRCALPEFDGVSIAAPPQRADS